MIYWGTETLTANRAAKLGARRVCFLRVPCHGWCLYHLISNISHPSVLESHSYMHPEPNQYHDKLTSQIPGNAEDSLAAKVETKPCNRCAGQKKLTQQFLFAVHGSFKQQLAEIGLPQVRTPRLVLNIKKEKRCHQQQDQSSSILGRSCHLDPC